MKSQNAVSKNVSNSNSSKVVKGRKGRTLTAKQKEKSNEKRAALIVASAEAKQSIALLFAMTGQKLSVNEFLMIEHKKVSGCKTFKVFSEWKAEGYRVLKGSKSFDIWGSPRKAKGADEINEDGETETGNKYKLFPVCSLFNESQVEKIEGFENNVSNIVEEKKEETKELEETSLTFVSVAEYRQAIESLERKFNCDRHACVGDKEKAFWKKITLDVMAKLECLGCKRAKPEDHESKAAIIEKVKAFFASEPTPPTPPKKEKEDQKDDINNNRVLDNGNNETLAAGCFPQANGEFLVMTFSESKTLKTEAGALGWLSDRGLDSNGESLDNEIIEAEIIEEDSPYVTSDFQERLEARKERYEGYSENAAKQSNEAYKRGHNMASVIPFGQPILVGHHSEKRDRRYREKIRSTFDKSLSLGKKAEYFESKAESVGTGGIASNDPEAVKKLEAKLQKLEASRDKMKAINKALRSNDDDALLKMGYTLEGIEKLKEPDCFNNIGFASYKLTNTGAEIRRLQKRIKSLKEVRTSKPISFASDDFEINVSDGYIVIDFKLGKPSEEVRTLIKSNAFKWSRGRGQWVRKGTENALYSTKRLIESLKNLESIY